MPNTTIEKKKAITSAAARAMGKARWAETTPEERSEHARWVASHGAGRPRKAGVKRCPCGAMTLKWARRAGGKAGTSLGHQPGCSFYREEPLKVRKSKG